MSTSIYKPLPPIDFSELRRRTWGRLFGLGIRTSREEAGLTIEEAACLSRMQITEWMAVEDGHVPREVDRLRAMAAALEISFEKMTNWVLLCREAWEL